MLICIVFTQLTTLPVYAPIAQKTLLISSWTVHVISPTGFSPPSKFCLYIGRIQSWNIVIWWQYDWLWRLCCNYACCTGIHKKTLEGFKHHLTVSILTHQHCAKKPVTTMLTYPWKCTVLHCNHLGNTWKPLVLMTRHFDYLIIAWALAKCCMGCISHYTWFYKRSVWYLESLFSCMPSHAPESPYWQNLSICYMPIN